jgi:hypothetical protein
MKPSDLTASDMTRTFRPEDGLEPIVHAERPEHGRIRKGRDAMRDGNGKWWLVALACALCGAWLGLQLPTPAGEEDPVVGVEGPASGRSDRSRGLTALNERLEAKSGAKVEAVVENRTLPLPYEPDPDGSLLFHALDPANRLASLDDSWIPTEAAFREHVEPLIELAGRLTLAEARGVFDAEDGRELAMLEGGDATLAEVFGVPTEDDVRALWRAPGTLHDFSLALRQWGYASALQSSEEFRDDVAMVDAIDRVGRLAWLRIFEQSNGYRWWPLLAEIGLRLEYGRKP